MLLKPPQDKTKRCNHELYCSNKNKKVQAKRYFFNQQRGKSWNNLLEKVVNSPTLNTFKNRLDKHSENF